MNAFIILALCALASGSASASSLKGQMSDGFKGQQVAATFQAPLQTTTYQAAMPSSQVLYSAAPAAFNYIRSAPVFRRSLSYQMPIRSHAIYQSAPLAVSYEAPIKTQQFFEARPAQWQQSVDRVTIEPLRVQEPIKALAQESETFKGYRYTEPVKSQLEVVKSAPLQQEIRVQEPIKAVAQETETFKGYRYTEPVKSQLEVVKSAPLQQEIRVQEPMRAQLTTQLHESFKGQSYSEAVKSAPTAQVEVVKSQEPIKSFQAAQKL